MLSRNLARHKLTTFLCPVIFLVRLANKGVIIMEKSLVTKKRVKWGNGHCNHSTLVKVTDQGRDTWEWACTVCGLSMMSIAWDALKYESTK
jgi:hypothetical protein